MSKQKNNVFVRALPQEITITETYRYTAEISENDYLSFENASGDIKAKFFYDGQGDHNWSLSEFLRRWVPFRWLDRFLRSQGKSKKIEKCFDTNAMKDAKAYQPRSAMATVGHLVLQGYEQPNFVAEWPEDESIEFLIPIDDFEQKLAQSQKYEVICAYPLHQPETPLINLEKVALNDDSREDARTAWQRSSGWLGSLHSKFDEELSLELNLSMDGGDPALDEDNQLPIDVIEHWWRSSQKIKPKIQQENEEKEKKRTKKNKEDDETDKSAFEQVLCIAGIPSSQELKDSLSDLALNRGGYLLIQVNKSDEIEQLKENILRASLVNSLPVLEPYKHQSYHPNRKPLIVIPVPMKPKQRQYYRGSHLSIQSKPSIIEVDRILGEDVTPNVLSKYISAIANKAEGELGLVISDNDTRDLSDILTDLRAKVKKAAKSCKPPMETPSTKRIENGLLVFINHASSAAHTVNGIVHVWKDGEPKELSVEETYRFVKNHLSLKYPLIMPSPFIAYAQIDWFYFDPREEDGVRYDPQKKVIKWPERVLFKQTADHKFEINLPLQINRPVELYRQNRIFGKIHIELGNSLKSGLKIHYFDAVGNLRTPYKGGLPKIKQKSKIEIDFVVNLDAIFRRRRFTSFRTIGFDGVRPELERLEELQTILADVGLESIRVDYEEFRMKGYPITNDEFTKKTMENDGFIVEGLRPPNLNITLHVKGKFRTIYRERKHGERADKMRVHTGNLQIQIEGSIQNEAPENLSVLMNRLQQLLTERFSHISAQVT
ncbi:MAG: hypothetical protein KDJ97_12880 [Anaerolineae bacterium]|nr:hypothetical protein [Anaerolineae bacterium]